GGERLARGCARPRRGLRRPRRDETRTRPPCRPRDRRGGRQPPGRADRHRREAAPGTRPHADLRPHCRPRASGQPEPRPTHGDPQSGMTPEARLKVTVVLSALMVVLGVALLIETVVLGGGIGYVLGGMLVVAGAGRLYVSLR